MHILGQFFFKRGVLALIENNHLLDRRIKWGEMLKLKAGAFLAMWIWVGFFGCQVLLILWLLPSPFVVRLEVYGENLHWRLAISVTAVRGTWAAVWPIPSTPAARAMPHTAFDARKVRGGVRALHLYHNLVTRLYTTTTIEKAWAQSTVGIDDAASTALLIGWVNWALATWLWARIAPRAITPPELDVKPRWDQWVLAGRVGGIFRCRGADIILAFWQAAWK